MRLSLFLITLLIAAPALAQMPGPPAPTGDDPKLNQGGGSPSTPAGKGSGEGGGDGMPGPPPPGSSDPKLSPGKTGGGTRGKSGSGDDSMPGPAPGRMNDPNLNPGRQAAPRPDPTLRQANQWPKHKVTGNLGVEGRYFPLTQAHPGQNPQSVSLFGEIEYQIQFQDDWRATIKPFFRWDSSDNQRTHFDLREAYVLKLWRKPRFELRLGVDKVFWGVTESVHLVDIINQDDGVENIDGEDKLGQPMLALTIPRSWGTVSLYYLPYFRERTFPGRGGRLRSQPRVEPKRVRFDDNRFRRWHPDFALRYSHTIREFDIGLHYFRGTSRDPTFFPVFTRGELVLAPLYEQIDQLGFDGQYTKGPWLVKLEAIARFRQKNVFFREENYVAMAGGVEYTLYSIFKTRADLGLLAEYLFDSRGKRAATPFENDIFVGARLALNNPEDTQALFGVVQDLDTPERAVFIEASTRVGTAFKVTFEARFFLNTRAQSPLRALRRDNVFILEVTYNFSRAWAGGIFRKR